MSLRAVFDRLMLAGYIAAYGLPESMMPEPRRPAPRPVEIPPDNPLLTDDGSSARREAALRMMDDDCYGFLLLTVHKEPGGPVAQIRMNQYLNETWWPAMATTLEQVAAEAPR